MPDRLAMPVGVRVFIAAAGVLVLLTNLLAVIAVCGGALPDIVSATAVAVIAGVAAAFVRRGQMAGRTPDMLGVLLGAVPACVAVGMSSLVHWDDFMTWMPNARAIAHFGRPAFLVPGDPSVWGGYPPAASLAVAAVWTSIGRVAETAPQALNVLALLVLPGLLLWETGPMARRPAGRLAVALLLALAVTFGNPSLDWHWVFSGCPDLALGVAVAIAAVLIRRLWLDPARPAEGEVAQAQALGAVLALIVALKQTGLVTLVLLAGAGVLAAALLGTPSRCWKRRLVLLAWALLPALITQAVWRGALTLTGAPVEMGFRPFSGWLFPVLPYTVGAIGAEMLDRWLDSALILLSVVVGVLALARGLIARLARRPLPAFTPGQSAAALFAPVWLGFSLFLIVANIGAFSQGEAVRAAEWLRYQSQVAQFGMLTALLWLWERRGRVTLRLPDASLAVIAAGLMGLALAWTAATGAPHPILGRHWAGVLDDREISALRTIAARAMEEAQAVDAKAMSVHVEQPRWVLRADQMSEWHIGALAGLILRYEIWARRETAPIDIVMTGPSGWREETASVAIVIGGEQDSAVVWTRRDGVWTAAARFDAPPSLARRSGPIGD